MVVRSPKSEVLLVAVAGCRLLAPLSFGEGLGVRQKKKHLRKEVFILF